MDTFTPLFSGIVNSSVWCESKDVKILWITMLALKDVDGVVYASVPGLSKSAGLTTPECVEALRRLLEPDEFSRTKDHDGRRLEVVEGGWLVLNHLKYREEASQLRRKFQKAKWAREKRKEMRKGKPLEGEVEYEKAFEGGASVAELDRMSEPKVGLPPHIMGHVGQVG